MRNLKFINGRQTQNIFKMEEGFKHFKKEQQKSQNIVMKLPSAQFKPNSPHPALQWAPRQ